MNQEQLQNKALPKNTLLQNGKYRIEKVLGQGGFGITYKAKQTMLKAPFAIKEFFVNTKDVYCVRDTTQSSKVTPQFSNDLYQKLRQGFIQEAQMLYKLDHVPNVVQIRDMFEENDTVYLVMDFVAGTPLSEVITTKGTLTEEKAVSYALQLLTALQGVHAQHILHRDIKPDNILIRPNDEAVLIDFGISRDFVDDKTQLHTVMLSHGYAPPEQEVAKAKKGAYSDLYSLGATLYYCLTGKKPQTLSDLNFEEYRSVQTINPKVSNFLDTIITKAIEKKPVNRFKNCKEFINALKGAEEETIIEPPKPKQQPLGTTNKQEPIKSEPIKPTSNGSKKIWIVLAGLVLVIATVVLWQKSQQKTETTPNNTTIETTPTPQEANTNTFQTFTETVKGVPFKMVAVKGGSFTMGSNDGYENEKPVHKVRLSDYYIGETLVTQALWEAVMGSNPSEFKGKNNPVENVSWNDAQKFIKKLNRLTGKAYRLPTEAEWEYAARGGQESKGYTYSGSNSIDEVAWYGDNSEGKTHSVKQKKSNELGLYDMSGNVWEWCSDWCDEGYYKVSPTDNPQGPSSGTFRLLRGGSWYNEAEHCRSAYRNYISPYFGFNLSGFRLTLSTVQ